MDQQTRNTLDQLGRRIAILAPKPPAEPQSAPAADPDAPWRDWPAESKIALGLNGGR